MDTFRRHVIAGLGASGVSLAVPGRVDGREVRMEGLPASRRSRRSLDNCYFTYPHMNGCLSDNVSIIITSIQRADTIVIYCWNFLTNQVREVCRTHRRNMYSDLAESSNELLFIRDRRDIVSVDVDRGQTIKSIYTPDVDHGSLLEGVVSTTQDGQRVSYAVERFASPADNHVVGAKIFEFDRKQEKVELLSNLDFNADHQHYCPADPRWIGFSHEGDIRKSLDRVWAIERTSEGPRAQRMWNEAGSKEGVLFAGHERWAFHTAGALVVAFGFSPGNARGLYFVDARTQAASLISESQTDWHCNISRRGRWAVVDTLQLKGSEFEEDGRRISDVILVDMQTGQRTFLARSHAGDHPFHPHPHFTPDARHVVFNDFQADGAGSPSRVVVVETGVCD
jgi:hypothetical protein